MAATEGGYLARHGLAKEEGIPVYTLIAVTPQHLLAFRAERDHLVGFKAGEPFATWERDHIDISVHARAKVRTFEIHDLKTDEKYEMEAPRVSTMHVDDARVSGHQALGAGRGRRGDVTTAHPSSGCSGWRLSSGACSGALVYRAVFGVPDEDLEAPVTGDPDQAVA